MPRIFYSAHIAWRLQYFLDNFVLPRVVKTPMTKQEKDNDVTMVFVDKDFMSLRYRGEDMGAIISIGSDFTFVSK
jgi:hypothetical protein